MITNSQLEYLLYDNDKVMGESARYYDLRIRDLPELQRPKEKLYQYGSKSLTVSELLAVLLGVGTKKRTLM